MLLASVEGNLTPSADALVSVLGVVGAVQSIPSPRGLSRLRMYDARTGNGAPAHRAHYDDMHGNGRVLDDPTLARIVAVAEAAERYAGVSLFDDVVLGTVDDLPGPVMDVARIPRCSPRELAVEGCPLVPFDPGATIRWVTGIDLASGEDTWLPAVMACYGARPQPPERFWYQLSTGHALHTDPASALVSAILEVVERDSIALLWLQQLPLPPLDRDVLTERARYLVEWSERHYLDTYLFDASTDLGLPVVYCLQVAEHDRRARQVTGCGAAPTAALAAEKALVEAIAVRTIYHTDEPLPAAFKDYSSILHGARFMAPPERAAAFDFLVDCEGRRPSPGPPDLPDDPAEALRHLTATLSAAGMQAIAVDRTSRELADAGLTAVAVVIPDLQPMSLWPLVQFRAHPRLYAAPKRMGYRSLPEEDLNPWPQPFA